MGMKKGTLIILLLMGLFILSNGILISHSTKSCSQSCGIPHHSERFLRYSERLSTQNPPDLILSYLDMRHFLLKNKVITENRASSVFYKDKFQTFTVVNSTVTKYKTVEEAKKAYTEIYNTTDTIKNVRHPEIGQEAFSCVSDHLEITVFRKRNIVTVIIYSCTDSRRYDGIKSYLRKNDDIESFHTESENFAMKIEEKMK
jgi:hypothetical protein